MAETKTTKKTTTNKAKPKAAPKKEVTKKDETKVCAKKIACDLIKSESSFVIKISKFLFAISLVILLVFGFWSIIDVIASWGSFGFSAGLKKILGTSAITSIGLLLVIVAYASAITLLSIYEKNRK